MKQRQGPGPTGGGRCRDCGAVQACRKFDFHRAAPPRCNACGGMLDRQRFGRGNAGPNQGNTKSNKSKKRRKRKDRTPRQIARRFNSHSQLWFGQYSGQEIGNVPEDYLLWVANTWKPTGHPRADGLLIYLRGNFAPPSRSPKSPAYRALAKEDDDVAPF